jgi:hypothetical protein
MAEEESLIESFLDAIEGTKSSAEFSFQELSIKLPGMNANIVVNGTVTVLVRPIHDKDKS